MRSLLCYVFYCLAVLLLSARLCFLDLTSFSNGWLACGRCV